MRILYLIWNYWPALEGGSERQARQIATEMARRGHACLVWTAWHETNSPRQECQDGVTILRFGRCAPRLDQFGRCLARGHQVLKKVFVGKSHTALTRYESFRNRFDFWVLLVPTWLARRSFMHDVLRHAATNPSPADLIHLHEPSWLGGFAVELAKAWHIPVICQEATNPVLPVLGYDVPHRNRINRRRKEAHFIAMAPYLADDLRAKGIPAERIHLLPNGVQIPDASAHLEANGPVLYVGNFSQGAHWKAFDILFEAWGLVHQTNPQARLVVLGGGDFASWQEYARQRGCEGSIDFMGRVSDPNHYYRKASMLILPSRVEGMSNALLEAQSWGLPCVVSNVPGNMAIVNNGVNGLVVPVGDAHALASAISQLLTTPMLRESLGNSARIKAVRLFSMNSVASRLDHIYQSICQ